MAAINWQKRTMSEVAGLGIHLDRRARAAHAHSNKNINASLSRKNYWIKHDFREAVAALKSRTAAVDAVLPPQRIRRDRVVGVMLEFPCPAEISALPGNAQSRFFHLAFDVISNIIGSDNVHGAWIHRDEIHDYYDAAKHEVRSSLEHCHVLVSPYVPGKGINGKNFETRENILRLDRAMCDMVRREFGMEYHTYERPRKRSVESLKRDSIQYQDFVCELQKIRAEISSARAELEQNSIDAENAQKNYEKWADKLSAIESKISDADFRSKFQRFVSGGSGLTYDDGIADAIELIEQHMQVHVPRNEFFEDLYKMQLEKDERY